MNRLLPKINVTITNVRVILGSVKPQAPQGNRNRLDTLIGNESAAQMQFDPVNGGTSRTLGFLLLWGVLLSGLILVFILVFIFSSPLVSVFNQPAKSGQPLPGITIEQAAPRNGLLVTSVKSDSEAERRGINVGSRIITINNISVNSAAQARSLLHKDHHAMIRLNVEAMHKNRIVKLHRLMESVNGT